MNVIDYQIDVINFLEKQLMNAQAMLAYQKHRKACSEWNEGYVSEYWRDEEGILCVKYESGNWWHYKNIDLPFPEWW